MGGFCLGGRGEGEVNRVMVPFPLDHFFFCFLPAEAAAGAWVGVWIFSDVDREKAEKMVG